MAFWLGKEIGYMHGIEAFALGCEVKVVEEEHKRMQAI
jgi:hypothetical protein